MFESRGLSGFLYLLLVPDIFCYSYLERSRWLLLVVPLMLTMV